MFGKNKKDENEESEELEFSDEEEYEEEPKPKPLMKKPIMKQQVEQPKPKPKEVVYVVSELPKEDVRTAQMNDGSIAHFITKEEALSELFSDIKLIKKALLES